MDSEDIDAVIGERIRTRRLEMGLSLADLAREIKVSRNWIALSEQGKRRLGFAHLHRIGAVLQVPVTYFFEGLETEPPEEHPELVRRLAESPKAQELLHYFFLLDDEELRDRLIDLAGSLAAWSRDR